MKFTVLTEANSPFKIIEDYQELPTQALSHIANQKKQREKLQELLGQKGLIFGAITSDHLIDYLKTEELAPSKEVLLKVMLAVQLYLRLVAGEDIQPRVFFIGVTGVKKNPEFASYLQGLEKLFKSTEGKLAFVVSNVDADLDHALQASSDLNYEVMSKFDFMGENHASVSLKQSDSLTDLSMFEHYEAARSDLQQHVNLQQEIDMLFQKKNDWAL